MMRTLALTVVLAAALALPASSAVTGLAGLVTRGPSQPVCRAEAPCNAPAPGVVLAFRRGHLVRTTHTRADGRYRVALPPGRYTVTLSPGGFHSLPRAAVVRIGRMTVANFTIDTGIR